MSAIRVTVWNENVHETTHAEVMKIYPDGIHSVIAKALGAHDGISVRTATLQQPEHGLTAEVLANTDVLTWWGHMAHDQVSDEIVDRVHKRVLEGMGILVLHSGHFSKIFKKLMGTACSLVWREAGETELVWVTNPGHPIAAGIDTCIKLDASEMYGEPFAIPAPEEQVFISWFEGGEVFRSGCCYRRGAGKVFYFSPGHETYPIYYNEQIQRVIYNAVVWAKPEGYSDNEAKHIPVEQARNPISAKGATLHDADGNLGH